MRAPLHIRLPSRAASEDGLAVVIVIQVLAILTLLVAATMGASLSLSSTTERDYNSKRALAGAISGLDVARYRLNKLSPGNSVCVTDRAVAPGTPPAPPGQCPAYEGDLGNGVTYGYVVERAQPHQTCGGVTINPGDSSQTRCVTSYGASGGVYRRVQSMVLRGPTAVPLFPLNGIVGLDLVQLKQTSSFDADVVGPVGSNGTFKLDGCPNSITGLTGWNPGPTAVLDENCTGSVTADPPRSTPWTLSPLASIYSGTQTVNDNATVFGSASGFQYTASSRELKDTSNATLIINGSNPRTGSGGVWTFNLCKLTLTHVTQIKLQNGAVARFLMDSNQRSGSGCGAGASLTMTNVSGMNYDTTTGTPGNPAQLRFFYYGTGQTSISNQSGFSASFYAPDGDIKFTNKTTWVGAIAAKTVVTTNGLDFTAGDVSSITDGTSTVTSWGRTTPGFVECTSTTLDLHDPEDGC